MGVSSALVTATLATLIAARGDSATEIAFDVPPSEPPADPIRVTAREPAIEACPTPDDSELTGDEATLARYWRVKHPCGPLPVCTDPHPIAKLSADVDPTDGVEQMIGSKRFGVAMTSARGELLGFYETECLNRDERDYLKLSARNFTGGPRPQLVIRQLTTAHCGELYEMTVVRRIGDELEDILSIDEGGHRGCNVWQAESHTRIAVRPGIVDVISTGWHREATEATAWEYGPRRWRRSACQLRVGPDGRFHGASGTVDCD